LLAPFLVYGLETGWDLSAGISLNAIRGDRQELHREPPRMDRSVALTLIIPLDV